MEEVIYKCKCGVWQRESMKLGNNNCPVCGEPMNKTLEKIRPLRTKQIFNSILSPKQSGDYGKSKKKAPRHERGKKKTKLGRPRIEADITQHEKRKQEAEARRKNGEKRGRQGDKR